MRCAADNPPSSQVGTCACLLTDPIARSTDCEIEPMSTATYLMQRMELETATTLDIQTYLATVMSDLFCLALLLNADADRAQDCVVRSIRECLENNDIAKQSLPVWVREVVVRNGIELVKEVMSTSVPRAARESGQLAVQSSQPFIGTTDYSAGILELTDFDRLVYVICIVEHCTTDRCALLLGALPQEIRDARDRALVHIARFESTWRDIPTGPVADTDSAVGAYRSECECACGGLLN